MPRPFPSPELSTSHHWACVPHSFLCVNKHSHMLIKFSFLIRIIGYIFDKLLFCTENFHLELSPCRCPFLCIGQIVYTCIVKTVFSTTSHLLNANFTMLYSSKAYTGTNNIEKFPVIQAKAQNLTLIRQNKILKVVYGILLSYPKGWGVVGEGVIFLGSRGNPSWIPMYPE